MLVGSHAGRVGHTRFVIRIDCESIEYLLEHALIVPASESAVDGFPRPESLRQISPGHACFRDEDDRVHEATIGQLRRPARPAALWRQQAIEANPIGIGQLVSAHRNGRSRDDLAVDPCSSSDLNASGFSGRLYFEVAEFADTP